MPIRLRLVVASACVGLALAGCSPATTGDTLTVFAAASLKAPFTDLAGRFEAAHPGTEVALVLAGSPTLVEQLDHGAQADVLATADEATMARAVTDGLVTDDPISFATNRLTVAVPPGNPAAVAGPADLTRPGLRLVTCAPVVPCGEAALAVAEAAGLDLSPVSEEQAVGDVLAKVQAGEADAGLVYVTDVLAAGDSVAQVPLPLGIAAVNHYPISVLAAASDPDRAAAFVDLVTGPQGRAVLDEAGFGPPR